MRKLTREGKGKVVLDGKVVSDKEAGTGKKKSDAQKRKRKEEKQEEKKSKACQAGPLVRRAVNV